MPGSINMLMRFCGKIITGLFPLWFLLIAHSLSAQETNGRPLPNHTVITNMAQLWTLPAEVKNQPSRVRMELLIYYCDTNWNVFWGNSDGLDTFLPLRAIPVSLKAGEKVFIDGQVLAVNQEFL